MRRRRELIVNDRANSNPADGDPGVTRGPEGELHRGGGERLDEPHDDEARSEAGPNRQALRAQPSSGLRFGNLIRARGWTMRPTLKPFPSAQSFGTDMAGPVGGTFDTVTMVKHLAFHAAYGPSRSFSLISAVGVLHHLQDPKVSRVFSSTLERYRQQRAGQSFRQRLASARRAHEGKNRGLCIASDELRSAATRPSRPSPSTTPPDETP